MQRGSYTLPSPQVKAHFGLDYESRVRGKNEVLLYGNFSDPKGGKVRQERFVSKIHLQLATTLVHGPFSRKRWWA